MVSSTPRLHFTPGKDPVPILQEAGWAPGPVSTGGKSRPHRDSFPDRPARSQSLYRLSYPAHIIYYIIIYNNYIYICVYSIQRYCNLKRLSVTVSNKYSINIKITEFTIQSSYLIELF